MRYLQYGQIKTTNRQFQTFRDLKSERSDRSRIGHESLSFCDLFVSSGVSYYSWGFNNSCK